MNNNSPICNNNKKSQEMHNFIHRKIKLLSLKNDRYYTNHLDYFSFNNKYENRRLFNEKNLFKTKLSITNNNTKIYDTNNSLVKSGFLSSKNIIKKAIEFRNLTNESLFKDKNESTLLTDNKSQKILPCLNFNSSLNAYLRNNILKFNSYNSVSNFMEKNRIQRRINYINKYCKSLVNELEKDDFYDTLKRNGRKSETIYKKYIKNINAYLLFLDNVKEKELYVIGILERQKEILIENIKNLRKKIKNKNLIKNQYLDIKNFLKKVKGDDDNNNNSKNNNNDNNIIIEKESNETNKYPTRNKITNLYLSPIKIKKVISSTILKEQRNKSPQKRQNKPEINISENFHFKSKDDINFSENIKKNHQIINLYLHPLKNFGIIMMKN